MEQDTDRQNQREPVNLGELLTPREKLGQPVKVTCLDCGQEFEARNLGRWTRQYCPACTERVMQEEEAERQQEEREAATSRQRERIFQAKIPELWRNTTFETSDPAINRVAFNRCREYAETFDPRKSNSLYLFSLKYGTGKTHLAACIANYVLHEKKFNVRYQKARDLLLDIRRTYSDRGDLDEAGLLDRVLSFDLLVLDDVGIDQPSQWLVSTYWTVFDRRMEMGLPVVVTANYNLFETEKGMTIGDRIGFGAESRLRKMCGENVIEFKGKDLR